MGIRPDDFTIEYLTNSESTSMPRDHFHRSYELYY